MKKIWMIFYFIGGTAIFNSMGIGFLVWGGVFFWFLIQGDIAYGFFYGLFFALQVAITSFLTGLFVGLLLGITTINLSHIPLTSYHNGQYYRFMMLIVAVVTGFFTAIFAFNRTLRNVGEFSIGLLLLLSVTTVILLGFASQNLVSHYIETEWQEKQKNT
jgi:hypothetical protein